MIWEPAHNCQVLADIQRFWQYRFQCGTFGSRSQLFHRLIFSSLCCQLAYQLNWEGQRSSSLRECCRDQSSKIIRCYITVCHILRGTEAIQLGSIALALCGEKVINIIMFFFLLLSGLKPHGVTEWAACAHSSRMPCQLPQIIVSWFSPSFNRTQNFPRCSCLASLSTAHSTLPSNVMLIKI